MTAGVQKTCSLKSVLPPRTQKNADNKPDSAYFCKQKKIYG